MLDSGVRTVLMDRVSWSVTYYISKAGLVERSRRGYFRITKEGLNVLKFNEKIDDSILMQYPSFVEFKTPKSKNNENEDVAEDYSSTPNEVLERGHRFIVKNLQSEILEQISSL